MKKYTLIDNETGKISNYSKFMWNFAWLFVFIMGVICGVLWF